MPSQKITITKDLIAPCGMNCAICSGYIGFSRNLSPSQRRRFKVGDCKGCRARGKLCAFLKKQCTPTKNIRNQKIKYCYECKIFPCENLSKLDKRYKENYDYSFIENLKMIKKKGITKFIKLEKQKFRCPKCGGTVNVHTKKCTDCKL